MNRADFAAHLGWEEKVVGARLNALDLTEPCSRCGGTGHYSFNQIDGTRCFKCRGCRVQVPRLTAKLAKLAADRVAAGGLDEYLARAQRRIECKRTLPGLVAECRALYSVVGSAYEAAYKASRCAIDANLFEFQTRANRLFWGTTASTWGIHPRFLSVECVKSAGQRGELDAIEAARILSLLREKLSALVAEFETTAALRHAS